MSRPASAWHRPGFRQLTRGWLVANVADAALFLMMAAWVKDLTGSDQAAAGVFVAIGLPSLIAPFLGQVADRMSRKRLIVWTCLVMIPILLTLSFVGSPAMIWLVYVVTFLYGSAGYVVVAAQSGLLRDLLPDQELASGNGILSTIDMGLRLVSPVIGTGLYFLAGPMAVVWLTVVCFAVAAFLLEKVAVDESPPAEKVGGEYWRELTAGFRHLWVTPGLGRLTMALAIGFGAAGLVNAAVFPAMELGFGIEPAMIGVLISLQGIGAVTGGATSARMVGRLGERRTIAVGMAAIGIGLFPLAGTSLAAGIAGLVLIGLGIPWVIVAYSTMRQRLTPPDLQGRTAAASNMAISIPQTLTTAFAAALLGILDYRLLIVATVAIVLVNALALRSPSGRELRLEEGT